jgi:hypothetical protein
VILLARKPENIHVYLFRKNSNNCYEYAIFQRADNPEWWQGVFGGVEEGETISDELRSELKERCIRVYAGGVGDGGWWGDDMKLCNGCSHGGIEVSTIAIKKSVLLPKALINA